MLAEGEESDIARVEAGIAKAKANKTAIAKAETAKANAEIEQARLLISEAKAEIFRYQEKKDKIIKESGKSPEEFTQYDPFIVREYWE